MNGFYKKYLFIPLADKYKIAYEILIQYFDEIPEEVRNRIDTDLKEMGL